MRRPSADAFGDRCLFTICDCCEFRVDDDGNTVTPPRNHSTGGQTMTTLTQTTANACGCVWNTTTARKMTSCTRHLAIDALRAAQELLGRYHAQAMGVSSYATHRDLSSIKSDVSDCNQAIGHIAAIIRRMQPAAGG